MKGKVLVVDDEPDIRLLLRMVLEKADYSVLEAEDGKKALDLIVASTNPDITCIITDYLMPRMNGLQLCENVRNLSKYIPIFLITAFLERERFDALKCFDGKFMKPLDFSALVDMISTHKCA